MEIKTKDLFATIRSEEFKQLSGVLSSSNTESNDGFFVKSVKEYCNNTNHDETYDYYHLEKANADDVISLLKEMDYVVKKVTLSELIQAGTYEDFNEQTLAFYVLDDLQKGYLGTICNEVYEQDTNTPEEITRLLIAMLSRLESHWEDHFMRFV